MAALHERPSGDGASVPPAAVCVLTMRVEDDRLLVSVLLNPDIRTRTGEHRFRPGTLEEAIRLVRDTAARLVTGRGGGG
ncbi:hypothetical protein ACTI_49010 [Actinoplanes sp. OR16]|uniref:hypothetical protein n=1 Tax=Actinoplanes sp. OR16 TaxID=946334 RepID=UPI000F6C9ADC|nr:hypothetical protein [Actinoplanes sp. OR16]BBH68216.1 hypothetical protein ACTI_49010 [Actinoplanes sp. OR16]